MLNDRYEGEAMQQSATLDEETVADEQFYVISAYIESLPSGLIGDEI